MSNPNRTSALEALETAARAVVAIYDWNHDEAHNARRDYDNAAQVIRDALARLDAAPAAHDLVKEQKYETVTEMVERSRERPVTILPGHRLASALEALETAARTIQHRAELSDSFPHAVIISKRHWQKLCEALARLDAAPADDERESEP